MDEARTYFEKSFNRISDKIDIMNNDNKDAHAKLTTEVAIIKEHARATDKHLGEINGGLQRTKSEVDTIEKKILGWRSYVAGIIAVSGVVFGFLMFLLDRFILDRFF